MRKVEVDSGLDGTEIIALQEKAGKLLESSEGQKILREISAFDALVHSDKVRVSYSQEGKSGYTTDDYQTHPERFSITDFYPAVYFIEDALLLTSTTAFTHRTRLEGQIADEMPDLYARLQKPEVRVILGDTLRVKSTDIQFFAVKGEPDLHLEEIRSIVARQLAERGILLLFWSYDTEWEAEQLKKPEFARYAAYKKRMGEASSRFQLFAEWGGILAEFGGHAPEGPERRYKWTIISPFDVKAAEIGDVNHSEV